MRLAIVGIRGIPNSYGGFETLAESLVEYLAKEISITVYCSSKDMNTRLREFKGARLEYVSITSHGAFGIVYDSISLFKAIFTHDKILVLGFGAGFAIPFLGKNVKKKIIVNIGGLDWQRNKWSKFTQKVIKTAEMLLIKNTGAIIADNVGIQKYIQESYGRESALIAYGGDQATKQPILDGSCKDYPFLKSEYAFAVARIQSDNNIEMILTAFKRFGDMPIVIVGNWNNSSFGITLKEKYSNVNNIILLDAIYDRKRLDLLRSNCSLYIHGHSAGGTNPALVEAMFLGLPVFAFASGYNEYTSENSALYFKNAEDLEELLKKRKSFDLFNIGKCLKGIAEKSYRWEKITEEYKHLIIK